MADCRYCGEPAGLLRKAHKECVERHRNAREQVFDLANAAISGKRPVEGLREEASQIAEAGYVSSGETMESVVHAWELGLNDLLELGIVAPGDEQRYIAYMQEWGIGQDDLDRRGAYTRLVQSLVLRDLMEGKVPARFRPDGALPFNLLKSESLVWVFPRTAYYEERIRRQYVGGSQGMSFRVMKGVYYRVGSFRGNPVDTAQHVHVATGLLAATTKHLYFQGGTKSFRIRYDKIVSVLPHSDGITVQRDAQTAKPQSFVTGEGWFTHNLVTNLCSQVG